MIMHVESRVGLIRVDIGKAIQVKDQGWLGHGAKVTQITHLTAPCRESLRDDQNGYLDHPIRSPDEKVTRPGKIAGRTEPDLGRSA